MRFLLLLFFIFSFLFASDIKTEEKIYNLILHTLLPNKTHIKVWCEDKSKENLFNHIEGVECIHSLKEADFLLLSKSKNVEADGIKFVTSYKLLELQQESVVGGFFWQKGRPNILFLRNSLLKYHINLPISMQEYIEDEL